MKRSAATWKRVAMSLRGLKEQSRAAQGHSTARRQLRVERLQPRELLAADTLHEPALQYTGGITIAGEVASPDVNADGHLNPLDALVIANAVNDQWGVEELPAGDLNQDQQLDGQDFAAIVQTLQRQGNLVAAPAAAAEPAAMGDGTVLDDRCAANEITIAMLQGQLDVLRAQLEQAVDPELRAFLHANIASLESSIASMQEDMNCGGGGTDEPGQTEGSGTTGSEGTAGSEGSGGTTGSEGTAGSGGGPDDGPPAPPPADPPPVDPPPLDPPQEPTDETPPTVPPGGPVDPTDPMPPSDPGDPPEGPNEGPTDELPGEIPPLPPGEPEIPPDFPGETPTGGGTDGTLGDMPPTDVPPTDIPPTDVPPSDIPPSDDPPFDGPPEDIPPEDIPPGEGTFGGGNTGATEFYVKELKIVPQGYSQGYDGSQVPPLYEGSMAEIRGKIDGPREYGELLPPPQLTLQADLNSDGDFDDPHEQAYSGPDSGMYFYGEEFSWSFPLVDDGPVPGDGEAQNVITVRAFFGTLVEGEAGTTDRFVSPDQDLSPDDMPQPPADDGPPITLATADVLNVDPYWTRPPELSWQTDEDGNPVAAWSIGYQDVGKLDAHRLQVRWGEGPAELLDAEPEAHEDCEEVLQGMPCEHEHTVLVTQQVPATAQEAESVTLTVADDDTGTADYTILNLDVIRNNDDDDQNERSDFLDSGHESEDDLVELDLTNFMTSEMDPQSDDYREGEFQLQYNGQNIHIWDSPAKDRFILPAGMLMEDALDMAYELYPGTEIVPYTGQEHVWVEGLQPSVNDVYLSYSYVGDPAGFAEHQAVRFLGQAQITVWGIDVDIDSDNNDGFDYPKNTQWEEYIEAHPFSLGKLIQPDDTHFTPIRLRLPPGLDPFDPTIRVELSNTDPDYLSLWNTHKADPVRDIENFLPLGDYILAELNYDPATGGITVWAEALVGIYDKMRDVAIAGVDEHVVTASLRGPQLPEPVEDEVKYKPVKPNSFFPRYIQERSWRNAVAADLVYGDRGPIGTDTPGNNAHPIDGPQFGQRYVREPELKEYLDTVTLHEDRVLDDDMKQFILDVIYYRYSTNNNPDGDGVRDLRVALYRDYNSGDYTLSYQGTNFFALEDWLVNLSQGIGATTDQYAAAQVLASYLGKANFQGLNLTGQSLGGGLASAGALASGIHADTFNAAGLSFNALWDNSHPDHRLEIVPGSSVRYARSARYITAYHVWMNPLFKEPDESRMINVPDILTFLQRNTRAVVEILGHKIPNMPNAVGRAVPIEGQYNIDTELEEKAWNKGWVAWAAYDVKLNSTFEMGMSHLFPSIYYGLMHGLNADGTEWNVFDNRATR